MLRSAFLSTKFCSNCSFVLANYKRHRKHGISTIIKISYQFFLNIITFTFLPWTNSTYGWLSKWQSGLSHSCPPPVSCFLFYLPGLRFVFFSFLPHQLYNWTIQLMQRKLLFLSLLFFPFNRKTCLSGFHLRHVSFNFRYCEILLFFLPFGLNSSLQPLCSWYTKWMSLHGETEACQYADCRYRAQLVNLEWSWFTNIRMVLRTK